MKLIYKCLNFNSYSFMSKLSHYFNDLPEGGRFYCNIGRAFSVESNLSRVGTWSDPFECSVIDQFLLPNHTPCSKTFDEISDQRAIDIRNIIEKTNKDCVLYYSGGIDSTLVLCSLIKNLDKKYLEKIIIAMSSDSVVENPYFYRNYIEGKFKIIDSNNCLYSELIDDDTKFCLTADLGDFIYGTELGIKFYSQIQNIIQLIPQNDSNLYLKIHDPDTHYSNYKDLIIYYYNSCLLRGIDKLKNIVYLPSSTATYSKTDESFGELFYEKINANIKSVGVDILSLHDYFWWTMFNMRFIWGALRPLVSYGRFGNIKKPLSDGLFSWYASEDYQVWSMSNNNNGQKMKGLTAGTYKCASKNYIFNFDKNNFYLDNKIKMPSSPIIIARNYKRNFDSFDSNWAVDENFEVVSVKKPESENYFQTRLFNYKIDWIN